MVVFILAMYDGYEMNGRRIEVREVGCYLVVFFSWSESLGGDKKKGGMK